jgi:hypothetical protein
MFPGSVVSMTRRRLNNRHGVRDAGRTAARSFRRAFASCAASKSREIDSKSLAGRFDATQITVPDRGAQAPGFAALYKCLPIEK